MTWCDMLRLVQHTHLIVIEVSAAKYLLARIRSLAVVADTPFTQFLSEVTPGEFITAVIAGLGVIVTIVIGRAQRLRDQPDVVIVLSAGEEYPASAYRPRTDTFEGTREPVIYIKIRNRTTRAIHVGGLRVRWPFGREHEIALNILGPGRIIDAESSRDSYVFVGALLEHVSRMRRAVLPFIRLSLIDAVGRRCASKLVFVAGSLGRAGRSSG